METKSKLVFMDIKFRVTTIAIYILKMSKAGRKGKKYGKYSVKWANKVLSTWISLQTEFEVITLLLWMNAISSYLSVHSFEIKIENK